MSTRELTCDKGGKEGLEKGEWWCGRNIKGEGLVGPGRCASITSERGVLGEEGMKYMWYGLVRERRESWEIRKREGLV